MQVFGSSGHLQRPPGGALRAYTRCLPADHAENRNIKTIANMAYVDRNGGSSHMFLYLVRPLACHALAQMQPHSSRWSEHPCIPADNVKQGKCETVWASLPIIVAGERRQGDWHIVFMLGAALFR